MKGARQAIRSQAAAREYVERQLAHAEATIQHLRTKLHHARQEKDTTVEAARSATSMRLTVQRALITTEAALATEKAARDRADRALREALATIRDLQGRLDAAAQGHEAIKAELAVEREARQRAKDVLREAMIAPKIAVRVSRDEAPVVTARRPVGRPRKVPAHQTSDQDAGKAQAPTKVAKGKADALQGKGRAVDDQEPLQWWIEGWDRRKPR
jgi:hypothetical protein